MIEEWKIYKKTLWHNKEIIYEVSNKGNVRKNGILINLDKDYKHNGYYRFASGYLVHRAVAELFIPNPENKYCVDHIDTNTFNNNVNNLRWVTHKENQNNNLTKLHLSKSLKGRNIDDVWCNNISIGTKKAMLNMSEEDKKKLRHFGNKYASGKRTEQQKINISIATKNVLKNPNIKQKMIINRKIKEYKWMTNGIDNKLISKQEQQEYLNLGWNYGRII